MPISLCVSKRVPYSVWYSFVATAIFICQFAMATTYAQGTPQEITERSDAWLRVQVQSISSQDIKGNANERIVETNMRADVVNSTDNQVPKVANLHYRSVFLESIEVGSEAFVAVSGRARDPNILNVYDWIPIGLPPTVATPAGSVDASLYWEWLCGLRRNADAWGKVSDEDLTFWKQRLASDDTAVATLAVSFFQGFNDSSVDASSLFAVFLDAYQGATVSPAQSEQARYEVQGQLSSVAFIVGRTLRTFDVDNVGPTILDFMEGDRTKLNILKTGMLLESLLPLLRTVKNPQTLARIPHIYETYCGSSYAVFQWIPLAPSVEIDEWLWTIVRDPAAHGIRTDLDLGGVWEAMEQRNVAGLVSYLRRVADGSEVPDVTLNEDRPLAIRGYATSIIQRIENKR